MNQLRLKHLDNLHSLFEAHTLTLATDFSALPVESLTRSLPTTKLGFGVDSLKKEFEKWQREGTSVARKAFDDMLTENAFVEFWGRLSKLSGEGVDGGVKAEELDGDEGEGFGGKVDMKALAKNVDLSDIVKVLKVEIKTMFLWLCADSVPQNDKRYIVFDHVPEQRERWIRVSQFRQNSN